MWYNFLVDELGNGMFYLKSLGMVVWFGVFMGSFYLT